MIEGCVESQEQKDKSLCRWLREQSSGFYRNCSTAAWRIEELLKEVETLKAENRNLKQDKDVPNKTVIPPPVELIDSKGYVTHRTPR